MSSPYSFFISWDSLVVSHSDVSPVLQYLHAQCRSVMCQCNSLKRHGCAVMTPGSHQDLCCSRWRMPAHSQCMKVLCALAYLSRLQIEMRHKMDRQVHLQTPQAMMQDTATRSPGRNFFTSGPTSTTTPMNCPRKAKSSAQTFATDEAKSGSYACFTLQQSMW